MDVQGDFLSYLYRVMSLRFILEHILKDIIPSCLSTVYLICPINHEKSFYSNCICRLCGSFVLPASFCDLDTAHEVVVIKYCYLNSLG